MYNIKYLHLIIGRVDQIAMIIIGQQQHQKGIYHEYQVRKKNEELEGYKLKKKSYGKFVTNN